MPEKCADSTTQFEVEEFILDYLIYVAIVVLLEDAKTRGRQQSEANKKIRTDLALQMVDSFLIIFRTNHSDKRGSTTLQLRLRLLKFTTIFTRRFGPSETGLPPEVLKELRRGHQSRAESFFSSYDLGQDLDVTAFGDSVPDSHDLQPVFRSQMLERFTFSEPPGIYGSGDSVSLLDTLPLFMALSAAQNVLQGNNVTELWMQLAARYMIQACLEQYLIYGAWGTVVVKEAFAYGFNPEFTVDEQSDELVITNMFWGGEVEGEVQGWREIRNEHLRALLPAENVSIQDHLLKLESEKFPMIEFKERVVAFLEILLLAQPAPVLIQFERGKIDGLSKKESQVVKKRVLEGLW